MSEKPWGRFERLRSKKSHGDGSSVSAAKRRTDREDDGTVPVASSVISNRPRGFYIHRVNAVRASPRFVEEAFSLR